MKGIYLIGISFGLHSFHAQDHANQHPRLIEHDEPTGNLDSRTTVEVMEMICSFARDFHQTIVLVSHDPEMAQYADRIVTLIDGEIVSDEPTQRRMLP